MKVILLETQWVVPAARSLMASQVVYWLVKSDWSQMVHLVACLQKKLILKVKWFVVGVTDILRFLDVFTCRSFLNITGTANQLNFSILENWRAPRRRWAIRICVGVVFLFTHLCGQRVLCIVITCEWAVLGRVVVICWVIWLFYHWKRHSYLLLFH